MNDDHFFKYETAALKKLGTAAGGLLELVFQDTSKKYYVFTESPLYKKLTNTAVAYKVNVSEVEVDGTNYTVATESRVAYEKNDENRIMNVFFRGAHGCGPSLHYQTSGGRHSIIEMNKDGVRVHPISIAVHPNDVESGKEYTLDTYYIKQSGNNFELLNEFLNNETDPVDPANAEVGVDRIEGVFAKDLTVHIGSQKYKVVSE